MAEPQHDQSAPNDAPLLRHGLRRNTRRGDLEPQRSTVARHDTSVRECQNCGAFVTREFERVFAGRDGDVHGYFECKQKTDIENGTATQR